MTKLKTLYFLSALAFSTVAATVAATVAGTVAVAAEPLPPSTVATVNLSQIMQDAKATSQLRGKIDKSRKKWVGHFDKRRTWFQKQQEEIREKREVMGEEAYNREVEKWERRAADENKKLREKQTEIEGIVAAAAEKVDKVLAAVVLKVARDHGANLVLDKSYIITAEPKLEITEMVMKELDKTLPEIDINLPEPE